MRRSAPRRVTERIAPRHTAPIVAAPWPVNSPRRVVAAEERGREVEHVAVDEAGLVEGVGDRGAALDEHLEVALGPELVEQLAEVTVDARGTGGPSLPRARVRAPRAAGRLWVPARPGP